MTTTPATSTAGGARPPEPANPRPVALVTGASRGLGYLIARELRDRGYDLVVCARDGDGLAPAAADLARDGTQVLPVAADVADAADADRLVAETERRFGRLDLLVTNAGVIQVGPAADLRTADFEHAMDVMYWGVVHTVHAALPLLRRRRGRVLAVASIGGKLPAPHLLPYTAAKHAAVGYAEGLRVEAARLGIGVTVAVPGLMRTGSTRNALFTGDRAAERRWFTLAAATPVLSMDARRAARRLVAATLRGRPEVVLTPAAKAGGADARPGTGAHPACRRGGRAAAPGADQRAGQRADHRAGRRPGPAARALHRPAAAVVHRPHRSGPPGRPARARVRRPGLTHPPQPGPAGMDRPVAGSRPA